jgi:hypothetical protein
MIRDSLDREKERRGITHAEALKEGKFHLELILVLSALSHLGAFSE